MKRFGYRSFALLAFVALAARPASAQVVNGGFETGDFTGWTQGGSTGFDGVGDVLWAHSGIHGAFFGAVGTTSTLSQDIATITGQSYTLSFWLANGDFPANSFDVSWDGSSLYSLTDAGPFGYAEYTFNVVGGASPFTSLQFTFRQDPYYFALDDVTLSANEAGQNGVVPEPATMSLLATGLAGMAGAGMRRRRKQA